MKIEELTERIETMAGVTVADLPVIAFYSWFFGPDGSLTVFKLGDPCMFNPNLTVLAMFESDENVRIYGVAMGAPDPKSPPTCYTLDKRGSTYSGASMNIERFIQEVASEWAIVDSDSTTAEKERERVVAFLRDAPPGMFANAAADAIEAGEHEDNDDDDAPDSTPAPPVPSETSAASKPS